MHKLTFNPKTEQIIYDGEDKKEWQYNFYVLDKGLDFIKNWPIEEVKEEFIKQLILITEK